MKLPATNAIQLPDNNKDWICISDDDPPAPTWDAERMRDFLPGYVRDAENPVQAAVLKALGMIANRCWAEEERILGAQQTPRKAGGLMLEEWGAERGIARISGESDGAYRARLLEEVQGITPSAIRAAVLAVLNPFFAPKTAVFVEPQRDFAFRASASWAPTAPHCFRQSRASAHGRIWANGRRTGLRTAGAYRISASAPPQLWVFIPATISSKRGVRGSVTGVTATAFRGTVTGSPFYHTVRISVAQAEAISRAVRALVARVLAGVVWTIYVEPALPYSIVR